MHRISYDRISQASSPAFVHVNRNCHFSAKPLPSSYLSFDWRLRKRNHARLTLQILAIAITTNIVKNKDRTKNSQVNSSSHKALEIN